MKFIILFKFCILNKKVNKSPGFCFIWMSTLSVIWEYGNLFQWLKQGSVLMVVGRVQRFKGIPQLWKELELPKGTNSAGRSVWPHFCPQVFSAVLDLLSISVPASGTQASCPQMGWPGRRGEWSVLMGAEGGQHAALPSPLAAGLLGLHPAWFPGLKRRCHSV